jgi:hypothetical protein
MRPRSQSITDGKRATSSPQAWAHVGPSFAFNSSLWRILFLFVSLFFNHSEAFCGKGSAVNIGLVVCSRTSKRGVRVVDCVADSLINVLCILRLQVFLQTSQHVFEFMLLYSLHVTYLYCTLCISIRSFKSLSCIKLRIRVWGLSCFCINLFI